MKVYDAANGGNELTLALVPTLSGDTLTLTHTRDIAAGVYYIAHKEADKDESDRLALTVIAYAPPTTMRLGARSIQARDEVYLGVFRGIDQNQLSSPYPVSWKVIGSGSSVKDPLDTAPESLFLLSKHLLGYTEYSRTESSEYLGDHLYFLMKNFYTACPYSLFTERETHAILPSPLVQGEHLVPLSAQEAQALGFGSEILKATSIASWLDQPPLPPENISLWWLRTGAGVEFNFMLSDGFGSQAPALNVGKKKLGVRPAMHMDPNAVLFCAAAAGGKSAAGMDSALTAVSDADTAVWKLTLLDRQNHSGFRVSTTSVAVAPSGGNVSVAYSGATVGTNSAPEYLSAMIVDSIGNISHYGRIKRISASADAAGTQLIAIPGGLSEGHYTLKLFNEQYNGDNMSDYASAFQSVSLTVSSSIPQEPETVATPEISPAGGSYASAQSVTLSCATSDAIIRYTTNGGEPDAGSALYTGTPISVSATTTIKAKAFKNGMTDSATAAAVFTIQSAPPDPGQPDPVPVQSAASGAGDGYTGNEYSGAWNGGVLTVQAQRSALVSVVVDGVQLSENKDFTAGEGSAIISFTPAYLSSLNDGAHTICVQFTQGKYSGSFSTPFVTAVTAVAQVPATNGGMTAGAYLMTAAAWLATGSLWLRRRKAEE